MLSSLTIGLISAACIFGGALLGLLLQGLLPQHHLRDNSKDTVKVVAGTIATLSALVLGLLVGLAKNPSSTIALVSAGVTSAAPAVASVNALASAAAVELEMRQFRKNC